MRISGRKLVGVGIGAAIGTAAVLLAAGPRASAQMALPHALGYQASNPTAAKVRQAVIESGSMQREMECLALNVYFEARGEPTLGKIAVAAVTLNRVAHEGFPDSICAVVRQGARYGRYSCQFSWACDHYSDRPRDRQAWQQAQEIAYHTLFLDQPDPTGGALYFHATRVRPAWSRSMVRTERIGRHIYYRAPMSVAREDAEPPRS